MHATSRLGGMVCTRLVTSTYDGRLDHSTALRRKLARGGEGRKDTMSQVDGTRIDGFEGKKTIKVTEFT